MVNKKKWYVVEKTLNMSVNHRIYRKYFCQTLEHFVIFMVDYFINHKNIPVQHKI